MALQQHVPLADLESEKGLFPGLQRATLIASTKGQECREASLMRSKASRSFLIKERILSCGLITSPKTPFQTSFRGTRFQPVKNWSEVRDISIQSIAITSISLSL